MVKKKSIMRKARAFFFLVAPSQGLFCMDRTRFARFAMNPLRGAWPPAPLSVKFYSVGKFFQKQ